jgi:predicted ATPase
VAGFTGRSRELAWLDGRLADHQIAAIEGMGGVGKTALAVHWAHTVADRFPRW